MLLFSSNVMAECIFSTKNAYINLETVGKSVSSYFAKSADGLLPQSRLYVFVCGKKEWFIFSHNSSAKILPLMT